MSESQTKDQWHKWGDAHHWPDWKDEGRRIEVRYRNGVTAAGRLYMLDMTPGPDESPIYEIRSDDGSLHSFVDCEEFRYAD